MDKTVKKIIDYLKGERFAYVEPKDVELVAAMVKGGMYFEGIDELRVLYDELLDKYVKEAINFYNFLYSKHDLGFSYLARVCEVLPFKKSRNPLIDMMILLKFNRVDLYDKSIITTPEGFWNVIRILLSTGHIMWNNTDYRNKELII